MSEDAVVPDKARLRAGFRAARRALAPAVRQAETTATIATMTRWLDQDGLARVAPGAQRQLASYSASGSELDLAGLHRWWWQRGGELWLPRVREDLSLAWHALRGPDALRPGSRGILEPDPRLAPEGELLAQAVVLVPGLAFTAAGDRLGQGAGCYDRLLAGTALTSVGIGFACQRAPALPLAPHDRRVAWVALGGQLERASGWTAG
jgi:5-formyltetrahydrofolate cyclo-ligase